MYIKANVYTTQSHRKLVAGNKKMVAGSANLVAKKSNERNHLLSQKSVTTPITRSKNGAPGRTRTDDLRITNALLYQLSYGSRPNAAAIASPKQRRSHYNEGE